MARFAFFTETADGLRYREEPPPWRVRLLFWFFGVAMFTIPIPFVMHAAWHVVSWTTLVAAVCVVAPVALGLTFIAIGFAPAQGLRMDRSRREIERTVRWIWGERHASFAFADVDTVEVHCNRHGDDGPTFQVLLRLRGRRPFKLGIWSDAVEAAHWRQRVVECVARSA